MKRYAVVVVLSFIWSAYYYSLGISNKLVSPFVTGTVIRLFTLILLTLLLFCQRRLRLLRVNKKALPRLLLIGCLGFLLDITAFLGSKYGNPTTGTILLKTDVLMVGGLSTLLYRQHFSKREWVLVGTMLAGVAMVLGITPGHLSFQSTDLYFLVSAFFVSVNAFLIKDTQKLRVGNIIIAYYNNLVTLLFFLVFLVFFGQSNQWATAFKTPLLLQALLVGSLGQFFVYIFYYRALSQLPVWTVKIILLLIPVITLLYDFLYTNQCPTPKKLLGTAIVLGSAVLVICCQRQQPKEENKK